MMEKVFKKEELIKYFMIILGTTLLASAINMFFKPNQLVIGGISGLAIVLEYITSKVIGYGIPLWITNIVVNIPLFILGIKLKGKSFGGKAIFASLYLSFALWYTEFLPVIDVELILVSIFGAIILGAGIGLVLKASASTGGTDLAATIIKHVFPSVSLAKVMGLIDACIIIVGLIVFGVQKGMYALIAIYIISTVVDNIISGGNASKSVHIISDKADEIAVALMKELNRGVTGLNGTGMYTKENKKILFVVCSKNEIVELQRIVKEIDDKAFLTITDIKEVFGRGFSEPQVMK